MTKSSDKPLGHTVTHTDTAQGKGGGRLTEKPVDTETGTPGAETAGQGDAENAKSDGARSDG